MDLLRLLTTPKKRTVPTKATKEDAKKLDDIDLVLETLKKKVNEEIQKCKNGDCKIAS